MIYFRIFFLRIFFLRVFSPCYDDDDDDDNPLNSVIVIMNFYQKFPIESFSNYLKIEMNNTIHSCV